VQTGEAHDVGLVALEHQQGDVAGALVAEQLELQVTGQGLKFAGVQLGGARVGQDERERRHQAIATRPQPGGFEIGAGYLADQGRHGVVVGEPKFVAHEDFQARNRCHAATMRDEG
jgi:hypothetical protein